MKIYLIFFHILATNTPSDTLAELIPHSLLSADVTATGKTSLGSTTSSMDNDPVASQKSQFRDNVVGDSDDDEKEYEDYPCFKVGYPWRLENENKPPECLDGLTVIPHDLLPYSRVVIGLGPETSGTTAFLDKLGADARVVPIGERDFFSWESNFRGGITSYLETHRRVYSRLQQEDSKFRHRRRSREESKMSIRSKKAERDKSDKTTLFGDEDDDGVNADSDDSWEEDNMAYEPLPPLQEMIFAEKSPLYGHYPLAAYRLHASLPHVGGGPVLKQQYYEQQQRRQMLQDNRYKAKLSTYAAAYPTEGYDRMGGSGLVWTIRNPIVRACSRLKKKCPSKRQMIDKGYELPPPGFDSERLANELRPLRDYKQCRAERLWWVHLCNASAIYNSSGYFGGNGRARVLRSIEKRSVEIVAGTVAALIAEHFEALEIHSRSSIDPVKTAAQQNQRRALFDVCDRLPPPRVASNGLEGWPFDRLQKEDIDTSPIKKGWSLELTHEFEKDMSKLLFESNFWDIKEARLVEEDTYFACHHFFRKISYHIYPAMYAEHLRRYRFLFPQVADTTPLRSGERAALEALSLPPKGPSRVETKVTKVGSILLLEQEDLLELPDSAMRMVREHIGLLPHQPNQNTHEGASRAEKSDQKPHLGQTHTQRGRRGHRGVGVRFSGGRRIDEEHRFKPRELTAAEMASSRCHASSVDPRDLLRVFAPSISDFYALIGRNCSWEEAVEWEQNNIEAQDMCRDWRAEAEAEARGSTGRR